MCHGHKYHSLYDKIVVDAYFGDEGKAKVVDEMARYAKYVVRWNDGNKTYKFNVLPCGITNTTRPSQVTRFNMLWKI